MIDYTHKNHEGEFESIKRPQGHQFEPLPQRWVVERSFSHIGNFRAFSKHYAFDPKSEEAGIYLTSVYYLLKRLTQEKPKLIIDHKINARLLQLAKQSTEAA